MNRVKIWHNPRCSKSREALSILQIKDVEIEIVKYLDTNPNKEELAIIARPPSKVEEFLNI